MSRAEEVKRKCDAMIERRARVKCVVILVAAVTMVLTASRVELHSSAQGSDGLLVAQNPAEQEKTAEQVYKNIQVLTGLPASELDGVMSFMSAALGVGCTHCHTNPWDSDVKSTKHAARRMILMTRAINKENFSSNPAITCYTCHRGQHNTEPVPPSELATNPPPDRTVAAATPNLPPTDEIIDRYIRAIGGQVAIEKLTTRVSRGSETTTNRMTPPQTLPIEIQQKAENKILVIRKTPHGEVFEGFNGSAGWIKDEGGHREMGDKRLAEIKRDSDFLRYLKIRQSYPQMRVLTKERVGDREAYVIGATSRDDTRERLYFDTQTGLLIRKYVAFKTALGTIPEVTDFEDYREVNGIKLPFVIAWSRPPFGATRKFTAVKLNLPIDDVRFAPTFK